MTLLKPYLVRAIYEWIVDNDQTPYLLVDATITGCYVPEAFVENGQIVLNLRPEAIDALNLGNQEIAFSARFGGKPTDIFIPISAVLAMYAKENGKGMVFDPEEDVHNQPDPPPKKPQLRVVK